MCNGSYCNITNNVEFNDLSLMKHFKHAYWVFSWKRIIVLLKYVLTHFILFLFIFLFFAFYSSGHVRLYYPVNSWSWWAVVALECPRGRPSWCMTQTTLAHNKAVHRGADFCLGRLLPPAPTADVRHESQHCLSATMPTTRPADVTRILMKIQNCLNLCLETNAGCCGRFFHSCKRF